MLTASLSLMRLIGSIATGALMQRTPLSIFRYLLYIIGAVLSTCRSIKPQMKFDIRRRESPRPYRGPIYRDVSFGLPCPINRGRLPINRTSIGERAIPGFGCQISFGLQTIVDFCCQNSLGDEIVPNLYLIASFGNCCFERLI